MKFGIFGGARQKRGLADTDSPTGYRDWIECNIEAEALVFCSSFTTEHHFTGLGEVSASLNLMKYLAAKTTTLRLGTAVMTLPWHTPVLLAERVATLDLVSEGRLDFGVGKCIATTNFTPSVSTWWMPTRSPTAWRLFGKAGSNMSCCRMRAAGLLAFVNSPKRLFSAVRGHRGCGAAVLPSGHRARRGAVRSVPASATDHTSGWRRQPRH